MSDEKMKELAVALAKVDGFDWKFGKNDKESYIFAKAEKMPFENLQSLGMIGIGRRIKPLSPAVNKDTKLKEIIRTEAFKGMRAEEGIKNDSGLRFEMSGFVGNIKSFYIFDETAVFGGKGADGVIEKIEAGEYAKAIEKHSSKLQEAKKEPEIIFHYYQRKTRDR
jgi:hypothetical protein